MYIKTIVSNTNGIISSSLQPSFIQKSVVYIQKNSISHDQDWRGLQAIFSIAECSEGWVNVSMDLLEYSGSGILFSTYFMAATDRKMLRNLTRATDFFFANWAIKTQLVHLENFHFVYIFQNYSAAH